MDIYIWQNKKFDTDNIYINFYPTEQFYKTLKNNLDKLSEKNNFIKFKTKCSGQFYEKYDPTDYQCDLCNEIYDDLIMDNELEYDEIIFQYNIYENHDDFQINFEKGQLDIEFYNHEHINNFLNQIKYILENYSKFDEYIISDKLFFSSPHWNWNNCLLNNPKKKIIKHNH